MDGEPGLDVKASHAELSYHEQAGQQDAGMGWRTSILRLGLHGRLNSAEIEVYDQALEAGCWIDSVHGLARFRAAGNICTYYSSVAWINQFPQSDRPVPTCRMTKCLPAVWPRPQTCSQCTAKWFCKFRVWSLFYHLPFLCATSIAMYKLLIGCVGQISMI